MLISREHGHENLSVGRIADGAAIVPASYYAPTRGAGDPKPALTAVRRNNKFVLNPVILKRGGATVTAVHHVGRRSGKPYVTPVWADRAGRSFFVHLPYGTDVDWCRNVLAGGAAPSSSPACATTSSLP